MNNVKKDNLKVEFLESKTEDGFDVKIYRDIEEHQTLQNLRSMIKRAYRQVRSGEYTLTILDEGKENEIKDVTSRINKKFEATKEQTEDLIKSAKEELEIFEVAGVPVTQWIKDEFEEEENKRLELIKENIEKQKREVKQ